MRQELLQQLLSLEITACTYPSIGVSSCWTHDFPNFSSIIAIYTSFVLLVVETATVLVGATMVAKRATSNYTRT